MYPNQLGRTETIDDCASDAGARSRFVCLSVHSPTHTSFRYVSASDVFRTSITVRCLPNENTNESNLNEAIQIISLSSYDLNIIEVSTEAADGLGKNPANDEVLIEKLSILKTSS